MLPPPPRGVARQSGMWRAGGMLTPSRVGLARQCREELGMEGAAELKCGGMYESIYRYDMYGMALPLQEGAGGEGHGPADMSHPRHHGLMSPVGSVDLN